MAKKLNDRGRYARLFHDVVNTPAWIALGSNAKTLYIDLLIQFNGSNNGNLSATIATMKHRGWRSSSTLAVALAELLALGFIVKTRGGGVRQGSRACCLYALSDLPIRANEKVGTEAAQPSYGFRLYGSVADAKRALEAVRQKKTTLRNSNCDSSEIEQVRPFNSSESEHVNGSTTSKSEHVKKRRHRPESRASARFQ